jgi:hypothetical protein
MKDGFYRGYTVDNNDPPIDYDKTKNETRIKNATKLSTKDVDKKVKVKNTQTKKMMAEQMRIKR